ncbi:MAG: intradiol ring-cleavage dioxygenase [Bacteroidetes bacterium]|nr:intradiol ring-cleavage dioxygenase [Bacteroidota bacterium]
MERKDFLRTAGALSITSLLPFGKAQAAAKKLTKTSLESGATTCILVPQETEGPYPYDLSSNNSMFRQDIRESNAGLQLDLTITLVNTDDSCNPVVNKRVDIWHCNKDGYYSEYANQPGYLGTQSHVGETFFRGIQLSDSNGQVKFTTIYPGWYTSRVTHIHANIFLSSVLKATTQFAFPDSLNTTVYNTSLYSAHGQNSTTNSNDNVFSDSANTQYEMLTVTANSTTGGYDASITIGIAAGTQTNTGLINIEPETGGQFKLGANYPNPFSTVSTIPFTLINASEVRIDLFDLQGRKVLNVLDQKMDAGEQKVVLSRQGNVASLATGSYVYELSVTNKNGTFKQCKLLTIK